jgi:hypothetical protein
MLYILYIPLPIIFCLQLLILSYLRALRQLFRRSVEKLYSMEFLDLFIVALMPVLKTLLITGVGLLLAIDRIGLLGPDGRHHLNNVSQ